MNFQLNDFLMTNFKNLQLKLPDQFDFISDWSTKLSEKIKIPKLPTDTKL